MQDPGAICKRGYTDFSQGRQDQAD